MYYLCNNYILYHQSYTPNTSILPTPHVVPFGNPLLPAVVSLVVVVLLLITCVVLLVLALAVTATKLNKFRAEKGHNDPAHYYSQQTGGVKGKTTERIYDEVGEGTGPIGGQQGYYQELKLETMEKRQYETLEKDTIAKA